MAPYTKPEYVLSKAEKLIADNKKEYALETLHDAIKQRKPRIPWEAKHEEIMFRHMELCVELGKPQIAKDALWQYRTMVQQTNVHSLEVVINKFLELARRKLEEAAKETKGLIDIEVDDLEQAESPETLLLKSVSSQDASERIKREKMQPALRFLWDSYKNCLELLRNNAQMEDKYHEIARAAYKFCIQYQRRTEFRKLCDTLRNHLSNIQKLHHQQFANSVKLDNAKTLAAMQNTRLEQLETAFKMEMWTEAFKSSEDIQNIIDLSRKQEHRDRSSGVLVKMGVLTEFYEKLAKVFWMSDNTLFHAAALMKSFDIRRQFASKLTEDAIRCMANRCVLAVLSIGPWSEHPNDMARLNDWEREWQTNQTSLTRLLDMSIAPSRVYLVRELQRHRIIEQCSESVRTLYNAMESTFDPLKLAEIVRKQFDDTIEKTEKDELGIYRQAILRSAATRTLKQVSQVYESIALTRLERLLPFDTRNEVEAFLMHAARRQYIHAQIDHHRQCVVFTGSAYYIPLGAVDEAATFDIIAVEEMSSAEESVQHELAHLHAALRQAVYLVNSKEFDQRADHDLAGAMKRATSWALDDWIKIIMRKKVIDEQKKDRERSERERMHEKEQRKRLHEAQQAHIQQKQLEEQQMQIAREIQRQKREDIRQQMLQNKINELKASAIGQSVLRSIDASRIENITVDELISEQKNKIIEERRAISTRQKAAEDKWNYWIRAVHLMEITARKQSTQEWRENEKREWNEHERLKIENARIRYDNQCKNHALRFKVEDDARQFVATRHAHRVQMNEEQLRKWRERMETVRNERMTAERNRRIKDAYTEWKREKEIEERRERERKEEEEKMRLREANRPQRLDKPDRMETISKADNDSDWRGGMGTLGAVVDERKRAMAAVANMAKSKAPESWSRADMGQAAPARPPVQPARPPVNESMFSRADMGQAVPQREMTRPAPPPTSAMDSFDRSQMGRQQPQSTASSAHQPSSSYVPPHQRNRVDGSAQRTMGPPQPTGGVWSRNEDSNRANTGQQQQRFIQRGQTQPASIGGRFDVLGSEQPRQTPQNNPWRKPN